MRSKNASALGSFMAYCLAHPEQRFWQALRNWSERGFVLVSDSLNSVENKDVIDTFYWEGERGIE